MLIISINKGTKCPIILIYLCSICPYKGNTIPSENKSSISNKGKCISGEEIDGMILKDIRGGNHTWIEIDNMK